SASRLSCGVPEAAVVNPGSSKITHEPRSSSVRERDTVGLSVVTLISVPARTLVPVTVYSLPLRLSTTGGCAGAAAPRPPGAPAPAAAPGPAAPPLAGPAPRAPPKPPPPPPPKVSRPISPLHTAAFQ